MKPLLASASLIAMAALCAGCAPMHSSGMGAGAAPAEPAPHAGADTTPGTVCQDGTILPSASRCASHGGVATRPGSAGSDSGSGR